MRVLHQTSNPTVLAGIDQSEASLQTAFAAGCPQGQRVNLPGDDPTASAAMVQNQAASSNVDQYKANDQAALGAAQNRRLYPSPRSVSPADPGRHSGVQKEQTAPRRPVIAALLRRGCRGILSSVVADANTTFEGSPCVSPGQRMCPLLL